MVNPLGQMGLAGHMAALLGFQPALAQATLSQVAAAISLAMLSQLVLMAQMIHSAFHSQFAHPTWIVRPPPNSMTQQFYPAISPATSPIVLYSTVTMVEFLDIKWLTHAMFAL